MTDLDTLLDANPPQPETAVTAVPSKPRRHRHAWAETSFGAPWPAWCRWCGLETLDPDGYFWPLDGADEEVLPELYRCPASPVLLHELGPVRCSICLTPKDAARSRRGRTNRQRGNAQERDWCKRLGLRRVGHFNGPEDGIGEDGMFVGQAKSLASARFPGWLSDELAKLPRSEGRIPILGLLETPGPGRRPRRLVVIEESDWIALHVAKEEA